MSSDPPAVVFEHCVTGGGRPVFFGKAPLDIKGKVWELPTFTSIVPLFC